MKAHQIAGSLVTILLLISTNGFAQDAQRRQGFWISFGLGGGWNTSEGLDSERNGGAAGYLRLGGTISPHVVLGAEVIGWGREIDRSTVGRGNLTFTALLYPSETGGLFLKGGVGGSSVSTTTSVGNTSVSTSREGFGTTLGLGIDLPVGRKLSIVPNLDWLFQAFDAGPNLQMTNTLVLLTVGLVVH